MDRHLLRVLLVEDEAASVTRVTRMLEESASFPYQLECVGSMSDAESRLRQGPFDVALLDLNLPDSSALDTLDRFMRAAPHLPVIVITAQDREDWAVSSIQRGAGDYLVKELLNGDGLVRSIRYTLERRRAADKRVEDQNLLSALLESTTDFIYFKDRDSRFTRINVASSRRFGLKHPAEAIGMSDADFFGKRHAAEARADELRVMETGQPLVNKEESEDWPDGSETWVSTTKMPLRRKQGEVVGTFGISRDITPRKRAEHELRHTEMFLNSIVENIPNMIFVKDAEQLRFVRFNRAGEELLGYAREELLGKSDYDFFPKEEADFFTAKDREVLRGRKVVDIPEEPINTRAKGERILHTVKIPLLDEKGRPKYLLGISEDITEKKKAEAARQKAEAKEREILERTDRLNTIGLLAAGMAHEINNPLQGMLSHLSRVKRGLSDDPQALSSLLMVERGVESISSLVQKLLALGSTGRDSQQETADAGEALRFVTQLTESQMARAGVVLRLEGSATPAVAMPEKELIQVLLNLLINARDAMPDGGTLTLSSHTRGDEGIIVVADNGIGMSEKTQQQIFTPFFTTKGKRGTGLGLVVAASMVHACDGEIEVDSAPGEGATFTLRIPLVKEKR